MARRRRLRAVSRLNPLYSGKCSECDFNWRRSRFIGKAPKQVVVYFGGTEHGGEWVGGLKWLWWLNWSQKHATSSTVDIEPNRTRVQSSALALFVV